jgi:hypothetical protein
VEGISLLKLFFKDKLRGFVYNPSFSPEVDKTPGKKFQSLLLQ